MLLASDAVNKHDTATAVTIFSVSKEMILEKACFLNGIV